MDSKKASEAAAQKATGEASQTQAQHSTETGVPRDSTETVQQPSTAAKTVLSVDDNKRDNKPLNRGIHVCAMAAVNICFAIMSLTTLFHLVLRSFLITIENFALCLIFFGFY